MTVIGGPDIVKDDLALYLDAQNPDSYPGSGTTWYDLSGNSRNSTIVGATFQSNEGCFSFAGQGERDGSPAGDYVTINTDATTTSPSVKPNGCTYHWWMRFDANQPQGHAILHGSGTINHLEWRNSVDTGNWRTEARLQNGYSFGANASSYGRHTIGEWFSITLVFANDEVNRPVRWYKDSQLFHTGNMTNGSNPSTEYFIPSSFGRATGSSSYLYSQSFYGRMSSFIIYDRTLTDAEISKNYNAQRARYI